MPAIILVSYKENLNALFFRELFSLQEKENYNK